jgi:4-amino-4-deoxy-L-arabinose transferase-like glycosyltransferase
MSRRLTVAIGGAIVLLYLVIQLAGLRSIGLTDDDDFYIPAGISYATWLGRAVTLKEGTFARPAVENAFAVNREHPPFAKYVFGICHALFGKWFGPYDGARVGTVLFSTLIALLMIWLAVTHFGRRRGSLIGGLAVAFLLMLPRFYFHSHAATLDVPVAAMYLAAAALALRGERSTKAALFAGPVFGLASATKLNAPFLLIPYLSFVLLVRGGRARKIGPSSPKSIQLPALPLASISMLFVGPLVFFASWPWIWFDTVKRINEYVAFHLNHYGIYFLYFGRIYDKDPFAPWHAPLLMGATTIPLATSALAIFGLLFAWPVIRVRLRFTDGPDDDFRREGDLLLTIILHAATTILLVAFSGGAKYGGEKLFMPFFPFWCLLAGYGAVRLFELAEDRLGSKWYPAAAISLALTASLALQLRFGAYALSQYNGLAGGLRGATALGFERQYYDVAFRDLAEWLNDNAPRGARVHFLPNNWEYVRTYRWYQKDGRIRGDLQVTQSEAQASWIVITHERRFARYSTDLLRLRNRKILKEKRIDGVPIWTVVEGR